MTPRTTGTHFRAKTSELLPNGNILNVLRKNTFLAELYELNPLIGRFPITLDLAKLKILLNQISEFFFKYFFPLKIQKKCQSFLQIFKSLARFLLKNLKLKSF